VVAAALELVDREGVEGLTMRSLGRKLEVDPMAIYHHVPGKAALHDAIVGAIWAELRLPPSTGSWQDQLTALARELRRVLHQHPLALPIVATRQNTAPEGLAAMDRAIGTLVGAGFGPVDSMRMVTAASAFVVGHALAEVGVSPGGVADVDPERLESAADAARSQLPHLAAALDAGGGAAAALDEAFETGIELLIDGADGRRRRRGRRR
jgi:TetR/AcrR family transcriptional regulator, tetracycline repressor protein